MICTGAKLARMHRPTARVATQHVTMVSAGRNPVHVTPCHRCETFRWGGVHARREHSADGVGARAGSGQVAGTACGDARVAHVLDRGAQEGLPFAAQTQRRARTATGDARAHVQRRGPCVVHPGQRCHPGAAAAAHARQGAGGAWPGGAVAGGPRRAASAGGAAESRRGGGHADGRAALAHQCGRRRHAHRGGWPARPQPAG